VSITVRQPGDGAGWAVALADAPGSAAEGEAAADAPGTSVAVTGGDGEGPLDPVAGASTEGDAPAHPVTIKAIVTRAPAGDRIDGL
jgi:hypothetical protein